MVSNLCSRPLGELTQVGQTRTCQQNTLYKLIAKYVLVNVGSSHPESRGQLIPQDEILYPIMGSLPHPPPSPISHFPKFHDISLTIHSSPFILLSQRHLEIVEIILPQWDNKKANFYKIESRNEQLCIKDNFEFTLKMVELKDQVSGCKMDQLQCNIKEKGINYKEFRNKSVFYLLGSIPSSTLREFAIISLHLPRTESLVTFGGGNVATLFS